MTRSAVRSRLAPPAFARFASYGSASPDSPSQRNERRLPRRSPKGEAGLYPKSPPYFPVNLGGRFSMKLATPSLKSLPFSATIMSRLAAIVASASVWNGTS